MTNATNALRTLTKAVLGKRCLAIRLDDQARVIAIEPHAVYTDSSHQIIVDFYQPPFSIGDVQIEGTWKSVSWRKIKAVFWLNATFEPRLGQGFNPDHARYQKGLLAIVNTGSTEKRQNGLWDSIDASVGRLLLRKPTRPTKLN